MAGMFDDILRRQPEEGWTVGEKLTGAMIPVLGLVGAYGHRKWREKKAQEAIEAENAPKSDVGRRMLIRAQQEGFESIPAMIAAKQYSKQAGIYPDNPGNAMAATANWMSSHGYPDEGLQLARVSHKELQTPWKPSETESAKPKRDPDTNLYVDQNGKFLPNQKVPAKVEEVVGEEMLEGYKWNTTDAEGNFIPGDWVAPPAKGSRYQSKTDVRVGGTDLSPLAKLIGQDSVEKRGEEYLANLRSFDDSITTYDDLINLTEKNPSGGIAGLSGGASRLVDQGINAAEFIASKTRVNEQGQTEAEVIGKYNSALAGLANRIFPESVRRDATLANSLIIQLAYELARMNNMGTAGGGRGITDADMRYALQQLASGAATSNFANVLKYQRQRLVQRYEREKSIAKDTFGDNTQHLYPSLTKSIDERMYRKPGAVSPGGTQDDPLGILK